MVGLFFCFLPSPLPHPCVCVCVCVSQSALEDLGGQTRIEHYPVHVERWKDLCLRGTYSLPSPILCRCHTIV